MHDLTINSDQIITPKTCSEQAFLKGYRYFGLFWSSGSAEPSGPPQHRRLGNHHHHQGSSSDSGGANDGGHKKYNCLGGNAYD